jgi:hypothetical protein
MQERDPGREPVQDRTNWNQAPVHAEIRTHESGSEPKEQHTKSNQHGEHDQISSNRPESSPPASPRMNDKPKEQSRGQRNDAQGSENISNMIDHGGPTRIALNELCRLLHKQS